jgi:hypothetical protein
MSNTHPLTIRLVGFRENEVPYLVGSGEIDYYYVSTAQTGLESLQPQKHVLKLFTAL